MYMSELDSVNQKYKLNFSDQGCKLIGKSMLHNTAGVIYLSDAHCCEHHDSTLALLPVGNPVDTATPSLSPIVLVAVTVQITSSHTWATPPAIDMV